MHKLFSRKFLGILTVVLTFAFTLSIFSPTIASANFNSADPEEQATSTSYYRTLRVCVKNNMYGDIQLAASDNGVAKPSTWFDDNRAFGYIYPSGKTDCKDIVSKALNLWGWGADYSSFLKAVGYTYNASNAKWHGPGDAGNGDTRQAGFDSAVQAKYYNANFAGNPSQSNEAKYVMFGNVFTKACNAKDLGSLESITNTSYKNWLNSSSADRGTQETGKLAGISGFNDDDYVYFSKVTTIDLVDGQYKPVQHGYAYGENKVEDNWNKDAGNDPTNGDVRVYGYWNDSVTENCHQIQKGITDNVGGWLAWALKQPTTPPPPTSVGNLPGGNNDDGKSPPTCTIEGIGWILCPVANAIAGMTDALFGAVTAFMKVAPLDLAPNNNPLFTAWSVMRTIANVAFVIVFLIIIFSQLTNTGVSNYGVKKLLPRLIVGAILVNVSFYVCAIAVDISNILGVAVQQLFEGISAASSGATDPGAEVTAWSNITSTVLAGVGTVGAGIAIETFSAGGLWGGIAALLPLIVGALFALIVAFLVLLARQALIIMMIVISPLAFVAFLLPNTEGLFKKWRELFMSLLVLFPLLSLVFGASGLAATILRSTSTAQHNAASGNEFIAFFLYIGSFAVKAIPFFITPLLIKLSGGVLNRFAGLVNNRNKGPFDRLRKSGERVAKDAQNRGMARKVGTKSPFNFGARRRARIERVSSGLENSAKQSSNRYITGELARTDADGNPNSKLALRMAAGNEKEGNLLALRAQAATLNEENEEAKTAIGQMNMSGSQRHTLALTGEVEINGKKFGGEALQRGAIQEQLRAGSYDQQRQLVNASAAGKSLEKFSQTISNGVVANGISSKDPALSGQRLDDISQGKFNYEEAVKQAITEGKYTAEAFAGMNDSARAKTIEIAQIAEAAGNPTLMVALRSAASGVQGSSELRGKISGNTTALEQINGLAPTNTPPSSGSSSGGLVLPGDDNFNIPH